MPGTRLPSTRAVARELGVARNTVIAAFEQLVAEGLLCSRVGDGTRVKEACSEGLHRPTERVLGTSSACGVAEHDNEHSELSIRGRVLVGLQWGAAGAATGAFQPGLPDVGAFPHRKWARALSRHARAPRYGRPGYCDIAGDSRLRAAIAAYAATTRGVSCSPEQVIVVAGAQAALDLSVRLLVDPGDRAWVEDPGYVGMRTALLDAGAQIVPVPVDAEGIDVEAGELRCPDARLAYVSPSCQFPLAVMLSLERRIRLLDWSERTGAFVIEDDRDSEYYHQGRPIAATQGLRRNSRVVYVGSFSRTMLPELSAGYVIAPSGLEAAFADAVRKTGHSVSQPVQRALAEFIDSGDYAEHVRRMRALYAKRKTLFSSLVRSHLQGMLELAPADGGMQFAGWFNENVDDCSVAEAGLRAGLTLWPLSRYWIGPGARSGLHLGYTGISESVLESSVRRLADVVARRTPA